MMLVCGWIYPAKKYWFKDARVGGNSEPRTLCLGSHMRAWPFCISAAPLNCFVPGTIPLQLLLRNACHYSVVVSTPICCGVVDCSCPYPAEPCAPWQSCTLCAKLTRGDDGMSAAAAEGIWASQSVHCTRLVWASCLPAAATRGVLVAVLLS